MTGSKNRKAASYRVGNSGKTVSDVFRLVNRLVFQGHGPDYIQRGGVEGIMVDPLHHFERLMQDLHGVQGLLCLTFDQILGESCPKSEIRCAIRHDVDIDIRTALAMAEIEHRYGAKSSYYILHTSPYYGEFKGGVFYRNESMIHVYREIQSFGHEIALHTDPLKLYQELGINGAEAVKEEIRWLRENGIKLVGTTAHNSIGVYGAENFAIFKGRAQGMGSDPEDCPSEIVHQGKWAPLGVLDEKEMGLHYEANDIFLQGDVSVKYAATRGINRWRWQSEISRPILRNSDASRPENAFVSHEGLIDRVHQIDSGSYLVLVVHPVYYGCRHAIDAGPVMEMNVSQTFINKEIGWESYLPETIVASSGCREKCQEFQAMNLSNEFGMLDFPLPSSKDTSLLRVAVYGGTNINAASVGLPAQMHRLLAEGVNKDYPGAIHVAKFAFPGMGIARYFGWYEETKSIYPPDVAILAVGADEIVNSLPEYWAPKSGYSKSHPPGSYLLATDEGVNVVSVSRGAAIRQRAPKKRLACPSLCSPDADNADHGQFKELSKKLVSILQYCLNRLQEDGVKPIILLQECGESTGLWGKGASIEQNQRGHDQFLSWLQECVGDFNADIIDPYGAFLKLDERQSCHWQSTLEWNCRGHEVAAEVAVRQLLEIIHIQGSSH